MKKATLIIWVIIFGFIALVIFQNQTFFLAKQSFRLNLGIMSEYLSPAIPNAARQIDSASPSVWRNSPRAAA